VNSYAHNIHIASVLLGKRHSIWPNIPVCLWGYLKISSCSFGLSNWSSRVYCWIVARSFGIKLANLFKSNVKGLIESSFTVSRTVRQYLLVIISKAVERSSNKEITPRRFWPLSETAIPLNPKLGSIALKSSAGYWKNLMRDVWKTLHLLASWFHKNLGC